MLDNITSGKPISVAIEIDVQSALYLGAAIFMAVALGIVLGATLIKK